VYGHLAAKFTGLSLLQTMVVISESSFGNCSLSTFSYLLPISSAFIQLYDDLRGRNVLLSNKICYVICSKKCRAFHIVSRSHCKSITWLHNILRSSCNCSTEVHNYLCLL